MRFQRISEHEPFRDTARKRAALARKQKRERDSLPLLADQIAETQPDADTVMRERDRRWEADEIERRKRRAADWRRARARLFILGDNNRRVVREVWAVAPYPATPTYFIDMLDRIDRGTFDPGCPPWIHTGPTFQEFDIEPVLERARYRAGIPRHQVKS
jgi:hypothetical protein